MNNEWNTDRRLDILVLGPMGTEAGSIASTAPIKVAVEALLNEPEFAAVLSDAGVSREDRLVHIPDGFNEAEIVDSVLSRLDVADLVIFNLTPKPMEKGVPQHSPNVYYELGLVHSLGIPAIALKSGDDEVPFYARSMRQHRVSDFALNTLKEALRAPLFEFLDYRQRRTDFANDRVTKFYGLPIVDISAAVGLATGYYYNFISRLVSESGFLSTHAELIKQVVIVRPSDIESTYQADHDALKEALAGRGYFLCMGEQLRPPASNKLGPVWFDHVKGIILDIPRTIYPLRFSPRLLSFQMRNQSFPSEVAEREFQQRFRQIGAQLLDRVEMAVRYHLRTEGHRVRSKMLHFTTIQEAPELVGRLLT